MNVSGLCFDFQSQVQLLFQWLSCVCNMLKISYLEMVPGQVISLNTCCRLHNYEDFCYHSCPMCSLIHQKSQLWEYLCVYTEIFTLLHTYMEREAYLYAYGEVHIYLGTVKEPRHVSCMYVLTVQFVWNTVCTRTHAENGSQLRGLWSFKEMSE